MAAFADSFATSSLRQSKGEAESFNRTRLRNCSFAHGSRFLQFLGVAHCKRASAMLLRGKKSSIFCASAFIVHACMARRYALQSQLTIFVFVAGERSVGGEGACNNTKAVKYFLLTDTTG